MGMDLMGIPLIYVRSSSYGAWENCQWKATLENFLGRKTGSNSAAAKGNVTHKALEILARQKLAEQNGQNEFIEQELGLTIKVGEAIIDRVVDLAFDYYNKLQPEHQWDKLVLEEVRGWTYKALEYNGGMFNPQKREIVSVEQYFDFEIDEPWANYEYEIQGKVFKGKLSIKGTMDLVLKSVDGKGLEYLDFKTGKYHTDFATGEEKTHQTLFKDSQLRIYHLALSKLYPNESSFWMTLLYLNSGGPISDLFTKDRLVDSVQMLKDHFEEVANCKIPTRILGDRKQGWKCKQKSICSWGVTLNPKTGQHWCNELYGELQQIGLDKFIQKFSKVENIGCYGAGGGVSSR